MTNAKELANAVSAILFAKKAQEILILEVGHLTSITDYFVICSGRNIIQVRTLAEEVEGKMKEAGVVPRRQEGLREGRWVVLDYASVIVHVFHEQERAYYNIERLWMDGSNAVHYDESE